MSITVQYLPAGYALGAGLQTSASRTYNKSRYNRHNNNCAITEIMDNDIDPCVAFWRAALIQQVRDARNKPRGASEIHIQETAKVWLRSSTDFDVMCEMADLPPEATRKAILDALERSIRFRLPNGEGPRHRNRIKGIKKC